jgi:hypothetical protein
MKALLLVAVFTMSNAAFASYNKEFKGPHMLPCGKWTGGTLLTTVSESPLLPSVKAEKSKEAKVYRRTASDSRKRAT